MAEYTDVSHTHYQAIGRACGGSRIQVGGAGAVLETVVAEREYDGGNTLDIYILDSSNGIHTCSVNVSRTYIKIDLSQARRILVIP